MTGKPGENPEERPRRRTRRIVSSAEVIDFLEYLAPPSLSVPEETWGLQTGAASAPIKTIVLSPMASFNALSTSAAHKQSLLLTCAPLITKPLHSVSKDDPIGAKVAYLLEHRINLYVLANSFASAPGGFDDSLAEKLGLAATSALVPTTFEPQYKLAVYTPPSDVEKVMRASAEAGGGHIGNYSHCSFQTHGIGTYLPREGSRPTSGNVGRLENADEVRLEMLVPQRELQGVIAAILEVHPYEEVAYDVYVVKNPGVLYGRGRIGELPLQVSLETVLAQVQDALVVKSVRCSHRADLPISSLAAASGVCDGLFWPANRAGAGALIAGGASLQDLMLADNSTTVVIDIGYSASVSPGLLRLKEQLKDTFGQDGLSVIYSA